MSVETFVTCQGLSCSVDGSCWKGIYARWMGGNRAEISVVNNGDVLPDGTIASAFQGTKCILTRPGIDPATGQRYTWNYYAAWYNDTGNWDFKGKELLKIYLFTNHPELPIYVNYRPSTWDSYQVGVIAPNTLPLRAWAAVPINLSTSPQGVPDLAHGVDLDIIPGSPANGVFPSDYYVLIGLMTVESAGPLPLATSLSPKTPVVAEGVSQTFTAAVSGGVPPYTYSWVLDGVEVATGTSYNYVGLVVGGHSLVLNVTDSLGSVASDSTTITVMAAIPSPGPVKPASAITISGHFMVNREGPLIFRGVHRYHEIDDLLGVWAGKGEDFNVSWNTTDLVATQRRIDENIYAWRAWGVNMYRIQFPFDWWWKDMVNPSAWGGPNVYISYRDHIRMIVKRALANGIYIILCPFMILSVRTPGYGSGFPVDATMNSAEKAFMSSINPNTTQAMAMWWTSIVQELGSYPNVLFEMWNEPDSNIAGVKQAWFTMQIEMYKVIRALTNNVVIFDWRMGAVPGWQEELTWIPDLYQQLKNAIGREPTNIMFDWHAYRYNWNPGWKTTYAEIKVQLLSSTWIPATRSATCNVYVGCLETGAAMDSSMPDVATELSFWNGLLKNLNELGISYGVTFWAPILTSPQLAMLEGTTANYWHVGLDSPIPNDVGRIFLAYSLAQIIPPTPIPILPTVLGVGSIISVGGMLFSKSKKLPLALGAITLIGGILYFFPKRSEIAIAYKRAKTVYYSSIAKKRSK